MRLVLIGFDPEIKDALLSGNVPENLEITVYCDKKSISDTRLLDIFGEIHPIELWPSAVNASDRSIFFVCNDPPFVEPIRFLAQNGLPMLVTHPACSMIEGFEIQMIQADTRSKIQPYFAGINHPLWETLLHWIHGTDSPIGTVKQLSIQRPLSVTSKSDVLRSFSIDALVLRRLMGRIDRLSAIGIESVTQADWSSLSAQMTGTDGLTGRWAAVPGSTGQDAVLEVVGDVGTARAALPPDPADWSLETFVPERNPVALRPWNGFAELLRRFGANGASEAGAMALSEIDRDWDHACRAGELSDAIEQSCRRNKTISFHHEQHTEEATFKGMMAAGGCLLLMALLGFMVMLQMLQTMRPAVAEWSGWTVVWRGLFLVFFGFLSLQLLRLVFRSNDAT